MRGQNNSPSKPTESSTTSGSINVESNVPLLPPADSQSPHNISFRKKLGSSIFRGLFNRSRSTSPNANHAMQASPTSSSPNSSQSEKTRLSSERRSGSIATKSQLSIASPPLPNQSDGIKSTHDRIRDPDLANRTESEALGTTAVSGGDPDRFQVRNTVLRTAYNGFNQLLNIAVESSDAFPPLKSLLGGLRSVLRASEVSSQPKR